MEDFAVVPRERLEKLEEDERLLNEIEAEARCKVGYGALHDSVVCVHLGISCLRKALALNFKKQEAV